MTRAADAVGPGRQGHEHLADRMSGDTSELHAEVLLPELLIDGLRRVGDSPAVRFADGSHLSGRELEAATSRYAQALLAAGVTRDGGVATLSGNRVEVLYTAGAEMVLGLRGTALHPMGSLDDHAYVLEDSGIDTLIYDPDKFEARAAALAERVPTLRRLLAFGPTGCGEDLSAAADGFDAESLTPAAVEREDVLRTNYTGGTTGVPKGVVGTIGTRTAMVQMVLSEWDWPNEPRHLVCSPLSHAGSAVFVPVLLRGGSFVVLDGFDPGEVLTTIERERITTIMLVPTMLYALLDHPGIGDYDLSSLEKIYYGASAVSPTRLREGIERFGPVFFQFYGQAEAPMTLTVMRSEEHNVDDPVRLASLGRPVPWMRVELLDDGRPVADGVPGEICVRGPLVMERYHNKPEQTADALEGGWLHTGDIAVRDASGMLRIVDRKKEMIVTGGFNVFPREIEDVICEHAAVSSAVVIGVADERWGEAVCAIVKLRAEHSVGEDELRQLVRDRKGPVQTPKRVEFVDDLPWTPVGKPDRQALKKRYAQDPARTPR